MIRRVVLESSTLQFDNLTPKMAHENFISIGNNGLRQTQCSRITSIENIEATVTAVKGRLSPTK